ncbi:hypothetical protein EX30DRAFT_309885 [Ascodesmis nigricans]|uniref:PDZ domain-containing protein n=1 Tax=Ascodesmis nigricans TaxID=341454 RepID=A0A4S2MRH4_9PEZI|nr:hypothetical protein EX30DRAFT_309885 [Ascodesmis nigricans]
MLPAKDEQPPPPSPIEIPRITTPRPAHVAPPLSRQLSTISVTSSVGHSTSANDKETWDRTLSRVINGIVSIKATTTRPFDTESAGDYTATGFVIDKKHGLILSNRHVVNPAPITCVAVFVNYEEVPIWPVYRDPVHDFGIFRYEPDKLKHICVEEIELHPNAAHVGEDIKVVGNDAGEKLSILGSTLARLDRHAPSYGIDSYNDFNTFYMQAASGTSGGSSGSPVLNIHGHAIALNAGGSNSSQSSFYLPLHRVVRAVEKIKAGQHVNRGTLQTEFLHKSYDELRRLGMTADMEEDCRARYPDATGLLSVIRVLRGGPASALLKDGSAKDVPSEINGQPRAPGLEPGDIVFSCNKKHITTFVDLWSIIDDAVDQEITLEIFRAGKNGSASGMFQVICKVQDLHSITPSRFLEIGGAIFHDLSYQMGRNHNVELETGVFCAASGFLLWSSWSRDFLITSVAGKPTRTLNELIDVIRTIPDHQRIPVMTKHLGKPDEHVMMVDVDRHFFLAAVFERDDVSGTWIRRELPDAPFEKEDSVAHKTDFSDDTEEEDDPESASLDRIKAAMVNVVCRLPYSIYGHTSASNYTGVGLIVALEPIPLVVFDRTAVPTEMLDIRLTVANKSFPGRVVYLGNFALVTFDGSLLPQEVTVPEWDETPLKVRDEVRVIGLTADQLLVQKDTTICSIGMNFNTKPCNPPRHRLINVENINVLEAPNCWGGVIIRKPTRPTDPFRVAAFYMAVGSQNRNGDDCCWTQGIDINRYILPIVRSLCGPQHQAVEPPTKDLGIEFADMPLSTVSTMGLSEKRFRAFVKAAKKFRGNPRPLVVETRLRPLPLGANEDAYLKPADIILEIDGRPIYRVSEITELDLDTKDTVEVIVLRGRIEQKLHVPTIHSWPSSGKTIVQFFGSILHSTHSAALEQVSPNATLVPLTSSGVYVGGVSYGSPALDNIRPTHWILEIDGAPVGSVDDVLALVKEKRWKQGDYVRVKQVSRKGITSLVSVKVDERFWPTLCWRRDGAKERGWRQERWSGEEFVDVLGK